MSITLVQLETFARVAALGNYTRVAEDLHLTQPGVTQQVRALERHFGVRLIDIVGRRPVLTEAGRFLATRAADLLGTVAALEREMVEFAEARGGTLYLGATLTIGAYALPALVSRFTAAYPRVAVSVEIANTAIMAERVRGGALSLALVEGPLEDATLEIQPFQEDRLLLVVPPGHRFTGRLRVAPRELAREPFIWREHGSGTRALAEQALAAAGVRPRTVLELSSGEGVARAVEMGVGVAILSQLVVERAVAAGRLITLQIDGLALDRTFRLVHVRERTLSPAARAFVVVARQGYAG
ncbi:MAG TPA: LysR family transcriptional regulator [Chloroflexota bacterium]|nr:LysR family transcriptional regulator [Chloroflexota bacterium]